MHYLLVLTCYLSNIVAASQYFDDPTSVHKLEPRGLASLFGGGDSGKSSSQNTGPPPYPSLPVNASCKALPFTVETWHKLDLDNYLRNYPGGQNLSVAEYAASKKLPSFDCGIGNKCHAGQLCSPANLADFYVLFSIQQWNAQRNGLVKAISYGINFVQSTINLIVASLFPAMDATGLEYFKVTFETNAASMMVSNTVLLDIFTFFNFIQGPWGDAFNILNNLMTAAYYGGPALIPEPKSEATADAFTMWAHQSDMMAKYEQAAIAQFTNITELTLNAGISSPQGIYNEIKNGTFIVPIEPVYLPIIEEDLKNVTTALALTQILRTMGSFVAIGTDVCKGKGKNGALEGDDVLSYCSPDGTMYNILHVYKNKAMTKFPNANVIDYQFGFSTQFLTNASVSCQQKHGGFGYSPWNNITLPKDPTADCVINLPVCDCRDPKIKKAKEDHGVLQACREAGLPI